MALKITVDREKCVGAAVCVETAPDVFELDDSNKSVVKSTAGDEETILAAAEGCPTEAITVVDEATGKQLFP
jgi:ferredoxin